MPIVGTFITAHAPGMTGYPEAASEQQRNKVFAAFEELRLRVEKLKPDLMVGISNDHFSVFFDPMPAFCIATGPRFHGPNPDFEHIMGLPCQEYMGHPEYAMALLEKSYDSGFDPAFSRAELLFEDQFPIPLHFLNRERTIPIVPVYVNCTLVPLPPLTRCFELGSVLKSIAEERPERILVLASGGLSHFVGTVEEGSIDYEFESRVLGAMTEGCLKDVLNLDQSEISQAGNGAHEIRNWLVGFGANPTGSRLEILAHEQIHEWQTGIVVGTIEAQIPGRGQSAG